MSREIKFRAWDGKRMLKAHTINDFVWMACGVGGGSDASPYTDTQFMQFTGLKDKNGKEIYESDIVRGDWHWDGWRPHVIEWPDDVYDLREYCLDGEDLEVLGNIYENPDLLEMK